MIDRRFWSGAIIAATVVVAGASALPSLLLAPGPPEPMVPAAAAPIADKAAPAMARVEAPSVVKAEAPAPGLVVPVSAPAAPAHKVAPAAAVIETPPPVVRPPAREAALVAFPPVQPVGVVADRAEPVPPVAVPPAAASAAVAERPAVEKPARAQRTAAHRTMKGKRRAVRPATFPLREFLAWRR